MSLSPTVIGIASALVVLAVGKAIDFVLSRRREELSRAEYLGELRAGFAALARGQRAIETRLDAIENRLDEHEEQPHYIHLPRG